MIRVLCATCATGLRVVETEDWSPLSETGHHAAAIPQGYISLHTHKTNTHITIQQHKYTPVEIKEAH